VQIVDYKPSGARPKFDEAGELQPAYPEIGQAITTEVFWLRDANRQ
jgi:hypothetical protein